MILSSPQLDHNPSIKLRKPDKVTLTKPIFVRFIKTTCIKISYYLHSLITLCSFFAVLSFSVSFSVSTCTRSCNSTEQSISSTTSIERFAVATNNLRSSEFEQMLVNSKSYMSNFK
ncbi:hypothetical protein Hanom_Chr14g01321151 [Helianthus anomalus]